MRSRSPLEVDRWLQAPITPPDELKVLVANVERLDVEYQNTVVTVNEQIDAITEVVKGLPALGSVQRARELEQEAEDLAESRRVAHGALVRARKAVGFWCQRNREVLIALANARVQELLSETQGLLGRLEKWAPNYDPIAIAREATKPEMDAYKRSRELDDVLQPLLAAFVASWRAAVSRQGQGAGAERVIGMISLGTPGGLHTWSNPMAVTDRDIRDGKKRDILDIASWAEQGGYRLAGLQQLLDITSRTVCYQPHVVGESSRRRILLPNIAETEARARKRPPARRTPTTV